MQAKVADKNIVVFKIVQLRGGKFGKINMFSPFYDDTFRYKLGKTYHQKITPRTEKYSTGGLYMEIFEGIYCLAYRNTAERYLSENISTCTISNFAIVTAIIPEGTKYYINERDEIVTEALKIVL